MAGNALIAQPAAFALGDGEVRLFLRGRPDLSGYARLPTDFYVRRSGLAASRNSLDPHMLVTATLNGRPLRLAIDTGAQAAVVLLPDASRPLWDRTPAQEVMVQGATGSSHGRLVRTGPLQLGGLTVPQVLVNLSDPAERHVDDTFDGLIGVDLLRQLEFVVDANAGRPGSGAAPPSARPSATTAPGSAWPRRRAGWRWSGWRATRRRGRRGCRGATWSPPPRPCRARRSCGASATRRA